MGTTKIGKTKILVFGDRNWAGHDDKQRVRYVDGYRLTGIQPQKNDAQANWLIDREAELQVGGCSEKEAKEKALLDWHTYMEPNTDSVRV